MQTAANHRTIQIGVSSYSKIIQKSKEIRRGRWNQSVEPPRRQLLVLSIPGHLPFPQRSRNRRVEEPVWH